jgi:hypothetical protein
MIIQIRNKNANPIVTVECFIQQLGIDGISGETYDTSNVELKVLIDILIF